MKKKKSPHYINLLQVKSWNILKNYNLCQNMNWDKQVNIELILSIAINVMSGFP